MSVSPWLIIRVGVEEAWRKRSLTAIRTTLWLLFRVRPWCSMKSPLERVAAWWQSRNATMSSDELIARIAADVTDRDVDRFLPRSLRKYEEGGEDQAQKKGEAEQSPDEHDNVSDTRGQM